MMKPNFSPQWSLFDALRWTLLISPLWMDADMHHEIADYMRWNVEKMFDYSHYNIYL